MRIGSIANSTKEPSGNDDILSIVESIFVLPPVRHQVRSSKRHYDMTHFSYLRSDNLTVAGPKKEKSSYSKTLRRETDKNVDKAIKQLNANAPIFEYKSSFDPIIEPLVEDNSKTIKDIITDVEKTSKKDIDKIFSKLGVDKKKKYINSMKAKTTVFNPVVSHKDFSTSLEEEMEKRRKRRLLIPKETLEQETTILSSIRELNYSLDKSVRATKPKGKSKKTAVSVNDHVLDYQKSIKDKISIEEEKLQSLGNLKGHAPRAGNHKHPNSIKKQRQKDNKLSKAVDPFALEKQRQRAEKKRLNIVTEGLFDIEVKEVVKDFPKLIYDFDTNRYKSFVPSVEDSLVGVKNRHIIMDVLSDVKEKSSDFLSDLFEKLSDHFKGILKLEEIFGSFVVFIYQLARSRNVFDMVAACYQYSKTNDIPGKLIKNYLKKFKPFFHDFVTRFNDSQTEIVTESLSDTLQLAKSFVSRLFRSELATTLRNLLLTVTSMHVFGKEMADGVYKSFGKLPKMDSLSLLEMCVDQVVTLIKIGESIMRGVPFSHILMAKDPESTCIRAIEDLLFFKDKLYSGLPVEGCMCESTFFQDGEVLLKTCDDLLKHMNPGKERTSKLRTLKIELGDAVHVLRGIIDRSARPTPVCLILCGDPGTGKGVLLPHLLGIHSKVKGRVFHHSHMYCRVITSQFFEGHNPYSEKYIHYPELGNMNREMAARMGDKAVLELTAMCDSNPYYLDMAHVDKKGTVYARPEVCVVDHNNSTPKMTMNLDVMTCNPGAYLRRMIFVEPIVKPQFRLTGGCGIDSKKSLASDEPLLDRWYFKVWYHICIDAVKTTQVYLMGGGEDDDIYRLNKVMTKYFTEHIEKQERMANYVNHAMQAEDYMEKRPLIAAELNLPLTLDEIITPDEKEEIVCPQGDEDVFFFSGIQTEALVPSIRTIMDTFDVVSRYTIETGRETMASLAYSIGAIVLHVGQVNRVEGFRWFDYIIIIFSLYLVSVDRSFLFVPLFLAVYYYISRSNYAINFAVRMFENRALAIRDYHYDRLRFLLFLDDGFNPAEASFFRRNRVGIAYATAGFAASIAAARLWAGITKTHIQEDDISTETVFSKPSEYNEQLNAVEDALEAGGSYKRILSKISPVWNVQQILSPCVFTGAPPDLHTRAFKNVKAYRILENKGRSYLIGLCNNFAIMNTHVLTGLTKATIRVSLNGDNSEHCKSYKDTKLSASNRYDLGNDQTLVLLEHLNFTPLVKHITVNDYTATNKSSAMFNSRSLNAAYFPGNHTLTHNERVKIPVSGLWKYEYPEHKPGMCGLPLIVQKAKGSCIAGFHCGGSGSSGFSVPFDITAINQGMSTLAKDTNLLILASKGEINVESVFDPMPKSPFRHEHLPGLEYYGRTGADVMINQKSSVTKTLIHDEVEKIFEDKLGFVSTVQYGPPMMRPCMRSGEYISPYNQALVQLSEQRGSLDIDILRIAINRYKSYILDNIDRNGFDFLRPYDIGTAINGAEQDVYLNRINAQTAGGFGFSGSKTKYIPLNEGTVIREPDPLLKKRLFDITQRYEAGETCNHIFTGQLKDEPRDIDKCKSGATRVFYITPLDALVVDRMYEGPINTMIVEQGDIFCSSVGINMHSGADKLARDFIEFSPLIMEIDYKRYDQSMPFEIGHGAATLKYELCAELGYNDYALNQLACALTDNLMPVVSVLTDLFTAAGIQPSGKYGTAEDNCIRNVLMVLYFWYSQDNLKFKDPFEYILIRSYGDDLGVGIKPEVAEYFNAIRYKEFCGEVYRLVVTPATKDAEMKPYVDIHTFSYLKRNFVYREDLERWVAPLALSSIMKCFMWTVPANVSPQVQIEGALNSMLWELAIHFKEEKYNDITRPLIESVEKAYFNCEKLKLPSYNNIIRRICGEDIDEEEEVIPSFDIVTESLFPKPCFTLICILCILEDVLFLVVYPFLFLIIIVCASWKLGTFWRRHFALTFYIFVVIMYLVIEMLRYNWYSPDVIFYRADCHERLTNQLMHASNGNIACYCDRMNVRSCCKPMIVYIDWLRIYSFCVVREIEYAFDVQGGLLSPLVSLVPQRQNWIPLTYLTSCLVRQGNLPGQANNIDNTGLTLSQTKNQHSNLYELLGVLNNELADLKKNEPDLIYIRIPRKRLRQMLNTTTNPVVRKDIKLVLTYFSDLLSLMATIKAIKRMTEESFDIKTESDSAEGAACDGAISTIDSAENFAETSCDSERVSAGTSRNSASGQANLLSVSDFFERPLELARMQINYNTDFDLTLDLWDQMTTFPSVRAKLKNYAYFRCKHIVVRVVVSANPFDYGRLLVTYSPMEFANDNIANMQTQVALNSGFRPLYMSLLSQMKGSSLINVNENMPLEIECPFISTKPMYKLFNSSSSVISAGTSFDDMVGAGILHIHSLNQMKSVSTSPSKIYISVYAYFVDVELGASTATQLAITTESGSDERVIGPIERIASRVASIATLLSPVIGPFAVASATVASSFAAIASVFGWSKPVMNSEPRYVKNEAFHNGALTIGYDYSKRVVLDPKQELTIDPRALGVECDEMGIAYMCSIPSYLTTFTWHASDAAIVAPIWVCDVTPCLTSYVHILTKTFTQPTPMAHAVSMFTYWRCILVFRFEFVISQFHRGKPAIVAEPNTFQSALINTDLTLNKQNIKVIDLQDTQLVEFEVEWMVSRPWALVGSASSSHTYYDTSYTANPDFVNGYIAVFPFTELQSPDNSDIEVNVYVYAKDMHVNGFSSINTPVSRDMTIPSMLLEDIKTESGNDRCIPSQPFTTLVLNPSSATTSGLCEEYFGEAPISFRALLKRFMLSASLTKASSATVIRRDYFTSRIMPQNNLPYNATAPIVGTTIDLFSHLYFCYLGVRGSIRLRARCNALTIASPSLWVKIGLLPPSRVTLAPTVVVDSVQNAGNVEGTVTSMLNTNGGIEAEFPFYTNNLFLLSSYWLGSDPLVDDVNTDGMETLFFRNYYIAWDSISAQANAGSITIEKASGEDFMFMRFHGAPMYSYTTPL